MLLDDELLSDALLRHLGDITEADLGGVESFQTELVLRGVESVQAELLEGDRGRADLVGQDSQDRPVLIVEAKFGAELSGGQVAAYLTHQENELGADGGALVLLVPSFRKPEAEAVLRNAKFEVAQQIARKASVSTAVITWDEWLSVWDKAAKEFPPPEQSAVVCDLRQLRELCKTMVGLDIPPLGLAATGRDLEERRPDLDRLVTQATAQFRLGSGQLLPMGNEPEFGFYRRYIPGGLPDPDCYCAVGVVGGLASEGMTHFWLRYSKSTSSFPAVSERIMESDLASDARGDGGHIWLPLNVSADRSGAALMEELTASIERIRAVAAGRELGPA